MKCTVKLVAELVSGRRVEHDLGELDREDLIPPAGLGLSIAEGKTVLAALQQRMVDDQVRHRGESLRSCTHCGPEGGDQRALQLYIAVGLRQGSHAGHSVHFLLDAPSANQWKAGPM